MNLKKNNLKMSFCYIVAANWYALTFALTEANLLGLPLALISKTRTLVNTLYLCLLYKQLKVHPLFS